MTIMALTPPVIARDNFVCVESAHDDETTWQYLHGGIRMAAWPHPDGGAIVNFIGGTVPNDQFEDDAALCRLSPSQLDAAITALQEVRVRTARLIIICGPMASGKTFHAPQIRKLFDAALVDDLPPADTARDVPFNVDVSVDRIVLLTNEPILAVRARIPNAQILTIEYVKELLVGAGLIKAGDA